MLRYSKWSTIRRSIASSLFQCPRRFALVPTSRINFPLESKQRVDQHRQLHEFQRSRCLRLRKSSHVARCGWSSATTVAAPSITAKRAYTAGPSWSVGMVWGRSRTTNFFDPTITTLHEPTRFLSLGQQFHQHSKIRGSISVSNCQVRWKRHDGNKAFDKAQNRKPTKKELKRYHRQLQAQQEARDKHSPPGSKAAIRRQIEAKHSMMMLEQANKTGDEDEDPAELEYNWSDAVVDDLIGNTSSVTSQPNPEPVYLGHKHKYYYNRVRDQMENYHQQRQQLEAGQPDASSQAQLMGPSIAPLPADREISLVLRAFRDRRGSRKRPVGLVKALQHCLQDLGVPQTALGEYSYTALMTCCKTPAEGRRVMQLQLENGHPISKYGWSTLVDLHAKIGDYKGCVAVMQEMLQSAGIAPGLPCYTSLLAACYSVVNNKRIPHPVRVEAADAAWKNWQEMIIVGNDPDVMAYGAMLRLCAAQGHAERALNLLEEMRISPLRDDHEPVLPTPLCMTSALRAIARSHAIALRYERGSSRKNMRRAYLTSHHGNMARQVLLAAEQAEVEQDDAFVAALIQCAAEAGDLATAKAVYVASQIRRLDHLRTIGSDAHLSQLQGGSVHPENSDDLLVGDGFMAASLVGSESSRQQLPVQGIASSNGVENRVALQGGSKLVDPDSTRHRKASRIPSYGEREYGKDTRVLSALLHACAKAADANGMGTLWQGRENGGYLCDNSLRLIKARREPRYTDKAIPMQGRTDNITWEGEHRDADYRGGKRRPRKFRGVEYTDAGGTDLDDLDEYYSDLFLEESGRLKPEYRRTQPEDIWRLKYGGRDLNDEGDDSSLYHRRLRGHHNGGTKLLSAHQKDSRGIETSASSQNELDDSELYFDEDEMRWKTRAKRLEQVVAEDLPVRERSSMSPNAGEEEQSQEELYFDEDTMRWKTRARTATVVVEKRTLGDDSPRQGKHKITSPDSDTEMYFDDDEMRWKTCSKSESLDAVSTAFESSILSKNGGNELTSKLEDDEHEFQTFFEELKQEIKSSGQNLDNVDEDEARELFHHVRDEFANMQSMNSPESDLNDIGVEGEDFDFSLADDDDDDDTRFQDVAATLAAQTMRNLGAEEQPKLVSGSAEHRPAQPMDRTLGQSTNISPSSPLFKPSGRETFVRTIDPHEFFTTEDGSRPISGQQVDQIYSQMAVANDAFTETVQFVDEDEESGLNVSLLDSQLDELRELLPAFSDKRLRRILKVFHKSLGDPSLLDLIPAVRERMPDYVTSTWLKKMSSLTARYVLRQASAEKAVDIHILTGVLEVEASLGSLNRAIELHQTEFAKHNLQPTEYSDRLVIQMLLANNRFSRALALKERIQDDGRKLDIHSYGSMIDYCSRRGQLGSAMLFLKECLTVHHGAGPSEGDLTQLRSLCRQQNLTETLQLESMIGEDPVEWLREGEATLKREMSKKGRRDVRLPRNVLLQV